jgi:hypothetical protein
MDTPRGEAATSHHSLSLIPSLAARRLLSDAYETAQKYLDQKNTWIKSGRCCARPNRREDVPQDMLMDFSTVHHVPSWAIPLV